MRGLEIARLRHAYYLQHDGEFQVHRVNCAVLARWNAPHPTLRNKRLLILSRRVLGDDTEAFYGNLSKSHCNLKIDVLMSSY